jgi:hypothetical protein
VKEGTAKGFRGLAVLAAVLDILLRVDALPLFSAVQS